MFCFVFNYPVLSVPFATFDHLEENQFLFGGPNVNHGLLHLEDHPLLTRTHVVGRRSHRRINNKKKGKTNKAGSNLIIRYQKQVQLPVNDYRLALFCSHSFLESAVLLFFPISIFCSRKSPACNGPEAVTVIVTETN